MPQRLSERLPVVVFLQWRRLKSRGQLERTRPALGGRVDDVGGWS